MLATIGIVSLAFGFYGSSVIQGATVIVNPFRIVLNDSNNLNSSTNGLVEVVISSFNYTGCNITEAEARFVIGEDVVGTSDFIRITREGNYQADFDRNEIEDYAISNTLEGRTDVIIKVVCPEEEEEEEEEVFSGSSSVDFKLTGTDSNE